MINPIDLARLRNGEFLQFVTNFSTLVTNNNPRSLNVLKQFNDFTALIPVLEQLFKLEHVNAISQQLVVLDERRDKAIIGLRTVIEGYCYHFDPTIAQAAKLLLSDLKLIDTSVTPQNFQAKTVSVNEVICDTETKPELASALIILDLEAWKNELKSVNQMFEQKFLERTLEYGASNSELLKIKRDETIVFYHELKKHLEANSVLHGNKAYQKTINEVNLLIEQYNTLLNLRLKEPSVKPAPVVN
jgi:hypothetical protein